MSKKGHELTYNSVDNVRIEGTDTLVTPFQLKASLPITPQIEASVFAGRRRIEAIMTGRNLQRLLAIIGPCSVHSYEEMLEYGARFAEWILEFGDLLELVMRTYFEKPRTTVGWKGIHYDPHLDGSNDVAAGLRLGRKILLQMATRYAVPIPCGIEYVDTSSAQWQADLVYWAAIGARTTESQVHREMASGLSMPVGFKNSTRGDKEVARDAIIAAANRHRFPSVDENGRACVVRTLGNPVCGMVLRGGEKPNYYPADIEEAGQMLLEAGLPPHLTVDCSHANSHKKYQEQPDVWEAVVDYRAAGHETVIGLMAESYLLEGSQKIPKPGQLHALKKGISVTDGCMSADTQEQLLQRAHRKLSAGKPIIVDMAPKRRAQGRPGPRPVVLRQPKPATPPAP